jgi:CBS domain-containing protein
MIRNLTIGTIMTPKPVCVEADLKLSRAKEQMDAHKVRHLPVTRYGRLAGVITEQNLKVARTNPFHYHFTVAEAMEVDPYIVPPETNAEDVLRDMLHYKLEYAVVARDENRPIGIFTRQDALKLLLEFPRTKRSAALQLVKRRGAKNTLELVQAKAA